MSWLFGSRRKRDSDKLYRQLRELSHGFPIWIGDDGDFVVVGRVRLPAGYNRAETELLIDIPYDYPLTPPGVGHHRVYVPPCLRYGGRELKDIHEATTPSFETPGFGPWAWWCYEDIRWDPLRDTLITFVEMIRADMAHPSTQ